MEMFTLKTTETRFPIKIDGQEFIVDYTTMHPSWIAAHLRKAAQRYLNDKYSGETGAVKRELIAADLKEMALGNPMPERERKAPRPGGADPVRKMARDLATTYLTGRFQKAFKTDDMAVWAKNDKAKHFLRFTGKGSARFDLDAVDKWMETFAKTDGGEDFMAKAKATLDLAAQAIGEEVSLDDLGI